MEKREQRSRGRAKLWRCTWLLMVDTEKGESAWGYITMVEP
jgi:hypothetical protein